MLETCLVLAESLLAAKSNFSNYLSERDFVGENTARCAHIEVNRSGTQRSVDRANMVEQTYFGRIFKAQPARARWAKHAAFLRKRQSPKNVGRRYS